jgi:hypothetical protein
MNKIFFLVPVASASVLLLAACGSSSPSPSSTSGTSPIAATAPSASSSGTYSTDPADEATTENALNESTAAYANAHYGTEYSAADEQCSPTYYESAADKSFVLWTCSYLASGGSSQATIKITGPHSWEVLSGDGN